MRCVGGVSRSRTLRVNSEMKRGMVGGRRTRSIIVIYPRKGMMETGAKISNRYTSKLGCGGKSLTLA